MDVRNWARAAPTSVGNPSPAFAPRGNHAADATAAPNRNSRLFIVGSPLNHDVSMTPRSAHTLHMVSALFRPSKNNTSASSRSRLTQSLSRPGEIPASSLARITPVRIYSSSWEPHAGTDVWGHCTRHGPEREIKFYQ